MAEELHTVADHLVVPEEEVLTQVDHQAVVVAIPLVAVVEAEADANRSQLKIF